MKLREAVGGWAIERDGVTIVMVFEVYSRNGVRLDEDDPRRVSSEKARRRAEVVLAALQTDRGR